MQQKYKELFLNEKDNWWCGYLINTEINKTWVDSNEHKLRFIYSTNNFAEHDNIQTTKRIYIAFAYAMHHLDIQKIKPEIYNEFTDNIRYISNLMRVTEFNLLNKDKINEEILGFFHHDLDKYVSGFTDTLDIKKFATLIENIENIENVYIKKTLFMRVKDFINETIRTIHILFKKGNKN